MKNILGLVWILLSAVGPVAAQDASVDEYKTLMIGDVAPDFSVTSVPAGTALHLKAFRGRVVLVNFWGTWCEPCQEEMPAFTRLKAKYKGKLEILGASVFSSEADTIAFARQYKLNFPVFMGYYDLMGLYNKVSALPTTFVIDTTGSVAAIEVGQQPEDAYDRIIAKLVK